MARSVEVPTAPIDANAQQRSIPFRQATTERAQQLPSQNTQTFGSSVEGIVEGSGFMYGIMLRFTAAVPSTNSETVAFTEDAPWNVLTNIVLRDVNGELVNIDGWGLFLANLINRDYSVRNFEASTNLNLYSAVTGGGATGGNFSGTLRVPVAINRRDLIGLVGNQDRAQQYMLRTNLNAIANLYTTPPTAVPTSINIERTYESYSVPLPYAPTGQAQEQIPPSYGTLRFTTSTLSESAPLGGSTVNHYLRRIGNTIRWIALVLRSNNSRATAETNAPTNLQFKVGDEVLFQESWAYRKARNFATFGFDMPNGVVVYDAIHDFVAAAGYEMGDDYYHTALVQNAQFLISYPSGFGSTANSLQIITDDMIQKQVSYSGV